MLTVGLIVLVKGCSSKTETHTKADVQTENTAADAYPAVEEPAAKESVAELPREVYTYELAEEPRSATETAAYAVDEPVTVPAPASIPEEESMTVPAPASVPEEEPVSEYILENSASRYLTKADLQGMSAEECRLARNELYARYGRKFSDEGLQNYFNACSWYQGTIDPGDFQETMLSEIEIANRDLIVEYEKEMGYR